MWRISWVANDLLPYQEGLCYMKLLSYCLPAFPACLPASSRKVPMTMYTEGQTPSEFVVYHCRQHINNTWSCPPVLCAGRPPSSSNRSYCNFCLSHVLIKCPGNLIKISCTQGTLIMPKPKRVLKYFGEVNRGKIWKTVWQGSLFYFMYYFVVCINRSTKTWRGENPKFTVNLQHCGLNLHTNTDQVWQTVSWRA